MFTRCPRASVLAVLHHDAVHRGDLLRTASGSRARTPTTAGTTATSRTAGIRSSTRSCRRRTNVNGCDVNLAFSAVYANTDGIDPVVGIFSHELSETMTDPVVNPSATGWWQNSGASAGYEIRDKGAYIYASGGMASVTGLPNDGVGFDQYRMGTDQYLMQLDFTNAHPVFVASGTFAPQTSFTLSPAGVARVPDVHSATGTVPTGSRTSSGTSAAGAPPGRSADPPGADRLRVQPHVRSLPAPSRARCSSSLRRAICEARRTVTVSSPGFAVPC